MEGTVGGAFLSIQKLPYLAFKPGGFFILHIYRWQAYVLTLPQPNIPMPLSSLDDLSGRFKASTDLLDPKPRETLKSRPCWRGTVDIC
jgi:hypothetical protein